MSEVTAQAAWYYTEGERQMGPVEFAQLVELARGGKLNPRADMVWGPDLADWKRAGEVEGLFEKRDPSAVEAAPQVLGSGGLAPALDLSLGDEPDSWNLDRNREWPGVDRRMYFFALLVVPVLVQIVGAIGLRLAGEMLNPQGRMIVSLVLSGLLFGVSLWAGIQRFPNLGMSRWWYLGHLVPLLNLWVGYRCFACPPGYACFRKLDGIGWVLAILYWLLVIAMLAALVLLFVVMGSALDDPGKWRELLEKFGPGAGGGRQGS